MSTALAKAEISALTIPPSLLAVAESMDTISREMANVASFAGGMQLALYSARAMTLLDAALTDEIMQDVMLLQGSAVGFKTDKDNQGGYPAKVVRKCLIQALMCGILPVGNEFNIIADNMYAAKAGIEGKIRREGRLHGISNVRLVIEPPKIEIGVGETRTAHCICHLTWDRQCAAQKQTLTIPIKVNQRMGDDAIIGKATRKAKAWLVNTEWNVELPEGEVNDAVAPAPINLATMKNITPVEAPMPSAPTASGEGFLPPGIRTGESFDTELILTTLHQIGAFADDVYAYCEHKGYIQPGGLLIEAKGSILAFLENEPEEAADKVSRWAETNKTKDA